MDFHRSIPEHFAKILKFKIIFFLRFLHNLIFIIFKMHSSLKLNTHSVIGKDEQKKLNIIVNFLYDNNDAYQFRQPVDWKGLEINDYPLLIKKPMDLGTIKNKLTSRGYTTVQEVLDDIQLVWDNCKQYNKEGWFYNLADKLERSFKKMVKNYLPNIQITIPSKSTSLGGPTLGPVVPQVQTSKTTHTSSHNIPKVAPPVQQDSNQQQQQEQIPQSEKIRFHQRLKKLTQQQLGKVVSIIQENAADAFRDMQKGRYQIILDMIDSDTFKKLNEKVDEYLQGQDKMATKKVKN